MAYLGVIGVALGQAVCYNKPNLKGRENRPE